MKAENWTKIKEVLHESLKYAPSQRREFFNKSQLTLKTRAEIESLLVFEKEAKNLLKLPAIEFSKDFFDEEAEKTQFIGQKFGVYEVVRELGCGGMGVVYLAERTDGKFSQRVAIKMLRREYNAGKVRRNFEREKAILASLEHPFIARLLDAGTTGDGVPFLVMEYIEGVPVDQFCSENALNLLERLKLFNKICEAVAFAHRNLIIHRDLKPSNILITPTGEPKLLDFGISKLLGADSENSQTITNLGAMTPAFASPEQIRGETVTTATDIYSLGVVLFKILTGALPFDLTGKTQGEIFKTITDGEPPRPSAVANSQNSEKRQFANTQPRANSKFKTHNSKLLKGDLDNILLKALAKTPARRYQTVEQFSADIWRFVDGLPVLARPATGLYRARKFYARNKIPVFAGLLIFLSLLAGITTALWQANVAREQARLAEIETRRAQIEKEKAEKISRFMSKVISFANPAWYAEGAKFKGEAKVIDALDEMSGKIDVEFADQPDIQAELHHKFSEVFNFYTNGKSRGKNLFHARRALELRKQYYGERHELVAKDMFYLSVAGGVEVKNRAKNLAEAIQMMRETNPRNLNLPYMLETYTAYLILPEKEEYYERYLQAAIPATGENRYELAERYLLESLPIFREHYREDNNAIFSNECKLAYAQIKQNKFADAAPHYQICKQALGKPGIESQQSVIGQTLTLIEETLISRDAMQKR